MSFPRNLESDGSLPLAVPTPAASGSRRCRGRPPDLRDARWAAGHDLQPRTAPAWAPRTSPPGLSWSPPLSPHEYRRRRPLPAPGRGGPPTAAPRHLPGSGTGLRPDLQPAGLGRARVRRPADFDVTTMVARRVTGITGSGGEKPVVMRGGVRRRKWPRARTRFTATRIRIVGCLGRNLQRSQFRTKVGAAGCLKTGISRGYSCRPAAVADRFGSWHGERAGCGRGR